MKEFTGYAAKRLAQATALSDNNLTIVTNSPFMRNWPLIGTDDTSDNPVTKRYLFVEDTSMVLSGDEIKASLKQKTNDGGVFVGSDANTPIPVEKLEFDTVSLEIHINGDFRKWKAPEQGVSIDVDPMTADLQDISKNYTEEATKESNGTFILKPKEFVICTTFEYVYLPPELSGRIEGKSKLARLGVSVHITAPTIQAGWGGLITLEMYNHSNMPVRLTPTDNINKYGLKAAQLIIEQVVGTSNRKNSSFNNSDSVFGKSPLTVIK